MQIIQEVTENMLIIEEKSSNLGLEMLKSDNDWRTGIDFLSK